MPSRPVTAAERQARTRRLLTASDSRPGDVLGLLRRVCRVAVRELDASAAGISVMTGDGVRGLWAGSDPAAERIEDLQFVLGEGPCIDAFDTRRPVLIAELDSEAVLRWPAYAPAVRDDGIRAVFAFPLQVGAARLGVLDVFRDRAGPLGQAGLGTALALVDVAVEMLLDRHDDDRRSDGVAMDVGNRAQLFQAQGMVMVQLGVPLGEAMARMRAHAFVENHGLADVARDIVHRRLSLDRDER